MKIFISRQVEIPGLENHAIRKKLKKALEDLVCHDKELSILLTDDKHMAQLNRTYLGRPGPTNVLAFPLQDSSADRGEEKAVADEFTGMLGDVVISVDTVLREAAEVGESVPETVDRLLIHGLLHLLGYEHEQSAAEAENMAKEEKRLLALIGEQRKSG
jgi:rRNA maturation RNase YbeY